MAVSECVLKFNQFYVFSAIISYEIFHPEGLQYLVNTTTKHGAFAGTLNRIV